MGGWEAELRRKDACVAASIEAAGRNEDAEIERVARLTALLREADDELGHAFSCASWTGSDCDCLIARIHAALKEND